ncbi:MAG: hypothetical protein QOI08_2905 [Actinomycetota bacterium]|nr:hypothetical protein [Actinomycetota bacterium]
MNREVRGRSTIEPIEPIVVIGAGASGLLTARALLRAGDPSVVLIERDASWSTGPAYATRDAQHLLNVPAGKLGVDHDRPFDFVDWASRRMPDVTPCAFLPRSHYGTYLRDLLDTTARTAHLSRRSHLARVTGTATRVDPGSSRTFDRPAARVHLGDGRSIDAAHVVLALGNPRPRPLAGDTEHVIDDPWSPCAVDAVAPEDAVVIVGTGLTAIDVALTLAARGHRGPLQMVSRRGLLPRPHDLRATSAVAVEVPPRADALTARSAMRWLRGAIADAGGDWRAVFDAVRPHTNEMWSRLSEPERARLLRLAGRYWEVHRHRIAPEVAERAGELVATGRLRLRTGGVERIERRSRSASRVVVRAPHGDRPVIDAHWVVNCTGPDFDLRRSGGALVRGLLGEGLARPGFLGLGFDVAPDGSLVDASGGAVASMSVVGPMRRGSEWETTAIPELRAQAEQVTARITSARPAPTLHRGTHRRGARMSLRRAPFGGIAARID